MAQAEEFQIYDLNEHRKERYQGIGDELRGARLNKGVSLDSMAETLRIKLSHLEAIEAGRFEDLPGPAYVAGFLRAYTGHVGLDGDTVVERYRAEQGGERDDQDLHFPEPPSESWMPKTILVLASVMIAAAAFGGWYYLGDDRQVVVDQVTEVPEEILAAAEPGPVSSPPRAQTAALRSAPTKPSVAEQRLPTFAVQTRTAALDAALAAPRLAPAKPRFPEPVDASPLAANAASTTVSGNRAATLANPIGTGLRATTAPAPTAPARLESAWLNGTSTSAPRLPTDAAGPVDRVEPRSEFAALSAPPRAPVAQSGSQKPRIYGQENAGARVVVHARQDSWVQVQSDSNELLLTRIMRAGDRYLVPNRRDLTLVTGNAGGIEVIVDGRVLPALGPTGAVRRDVRLSPDALRALVDSN